ncbi:alcohol dehydrogenase [Microlunatus phosphovorus NM-1]|uniref:Alcohol dehydrogenase n=1 Tax=Microlunatus phosphovorus (strain ATCC 700054 / DSM 10555 / JCM 9379 / NBRC 101784 / NCIMB 13414 / VKM Ac-1990 / NM-1) TaxID=1032480 RepID=F5XIW7_MICPN|nr:zinc-dependent alcohol dehydrogenase family protein [Microlunatus phosphovorus]BAK33293.1 alcohol dehydrogenase [Microlunatus phosphovorus NM-1]
MLAVRYAGYGMAPELVEMPSPVCPDDGVLLDVLATGVCRSDWHAWRGHDPVSLPHVPGHEIAGVVSQIGRDVTRFAVGDLVTTPFVNGCGSCEFCLGGDAQVCPQQTQPGFTHHGSFAEQVALYAADTNLVRLPEGMDPVVAASLGCRFATAYRAVTARGRVGTGDLVAVFGCGGVGLSAIQIAIALGAQVFAVDVSDLARQRAADLGAVALAPDSVVERITDLTGGGVHVAIDALGSASTELAAVRSLRRRGRYVQVGLMLGPDARAPLPWDLVVAYELEVYGSHGMAACDYPAMLSMVSSGILRPAELVGRVISLAEAPAALVAMDSPASSTAGMTVIDLTRH